MGILLGGHAFDVPAPRLLPALWCTLGTGALLAAIEAGPRLLWFHQGRGLMTLGKLVLVALVPWFWQQRLVLLLAVVVIGSVGSHMPARYRYYSILYRKEIRCGSGPGTSQLGNGRFETAAEALPQDVPSFCGRGVGGEGIANRKPPSP